MLNTVSHHEGKLISFLSKPKCKNISKTRLQFNLAVQQPQPMTRNTLIYNQPRSKPRLAKSGNNSMMRELMFVPAPRFQSPLNCTRTSLPLVPVNTIGGVSESQGKKSVLVTETTSCNQIPFLSIFC